MGPSVPSEYFIALYRDTADPWNFETSEYEREKYSATITALPRARYRSGCELGCSIGVFTQMLAKRCDRLTAVDVSPAVGGWYDVTTVCEIGYYFCAADLDTLCRNVVRHSMPNATIVVVHWTPRTPGHALPASIVHERFCGDLSLQRLTGFTNGTYRLDVLQRRNDAV